MKRRKNNLLVIWSNISPSVIAFFTFLPLLTVVNCDDAAKLIVRPESSTVPADSRVSFFCRSDGNPLPAVTWRRNNQPLSSDRRYVTKSLENGLSTLRIEPVYASDNNTKITCSAYNGVARPVSAEATLTVLLPNELPSGFPRIEANPVLKAVEQGRTAYVTCRVRGDPLPKVLWLRDLMPVDIRSNSRYSVSTLGNPGALMIQQALPEDQGKYECIARNIHGVVHSLGANLYVKVRRVPPYFTVKPERLYKVGPQGSINLTCVASGYPMPRVFWKNPEDAYTEDVNHAPIGKNVLTLTNLQKSGNYTCVAVSKLGNIEKTTTVEVKELPMAPRNLRITEVKADRVKLQWDKVTIDNGEPIKEYIVRYRQKYGESGSYKERNVPSSENYVVITDLEPYQIYEFTVLSRNAIGRGTASLPKEVQTEEALPSSAPQKVQARAMSMGQVLVRWEAPEKPNGKITGYQVHYTQLPPSTPFPMWKKLEKKADEQMATLSGLEQGRTYYVVVSAANSKGLGPVSNIVTVINTQGIPGQVMNLKAIPLDSRRVQLTWTKPDSQYAVVAYIIRFNTSTGDVHELELTRPEEKFIIDGLEPNTRYSFRVAAKTTRGRGAFCDDVFGVTKESVPTGAPEITKVEVVSSKSLLIRWKPPIREQQNGVIVQYLLKWRPVLDANATDFDEVSGEEDGEEDIEKKAKTETEWTEAIRSATLESSVLIENLNPFTMYEVTVAAGTEKGFGPASEPRREQTAEDVPSAPRDIEVVLVNASAVKVSWERPTHENGKILGYYVYREKLKNGEATQGHMRRGIILHWNSTNTLITDLEPNTEYRFQVNAFNRNGDGEFSAEKTILTGGIPPSPPVVKEVKLLTYETPLVAHVGWSPPEFTYGIPLKQYVIWYRPQEYGEAKKVVVPKDQQSVELSDLLMGRNYEISVAAENEEGLSANATEILSTPVGVPETEPLNVRYELADGQMTVSWDPPAIDQRNGNITYYRAILTPVEPGEERIDRNVTNAQSVTFDTSSRKAFTFKVAAATMKGLGPFSPVVNIDTDPSAQIPAPRDVRVQAMSSTSVVVEWNWNNMTNGDVNGFVVKYIHEPQSGQRTGDRWEQGKGMVGPDVRFQIIDSLTAHKPYAFCVVALRDKRQGPCSDPPVFIDRLDPIHVVTNLRAEAKTKDTITLKWDYSGPDKLGFRVVYSGEKDWSEISSDVGSKPQPLIVLPMNATTERKEIKLAGLRPYFNYTIKVAVRKTSKENYYPKEIMVMTEPAGPPFVPIPKFIGSPEPGQAEIALASANEEFGPISHYWLIVLPANYTQGDISSRRLDSHTLQRSTTQMRIRQERLHYEQKSIKKARKANKRHHNKRYSASDYRRAVPKDSGGIYIAARLGAQEVLDHHLKQKSFILGDERKYGEYTNYRLDSSAEYTVMMRAFAKRGSRSGPFDSGRAAEFDENLYTDSNLSAPFSTKPAGYAREMKTSNLWLIAPLVAVLVIMLIVGMLVIWWLRCNKKSSSHTTTRHGSITKVALAGSNIPSETSKLLVSGDVYGRQIMSPYDQMNGDGRCAIESSVDMYPLHQSHHSNNYSAVPVPMSLLPSSGGVVGGHTLSHPPIPISELAAHIDRLKMNNNALFSQEYESIETGQHFTWDHSNMENNKPKNRYANVVAYDHSRVILNTVEGVPDSDYINANYIDGYEKPKAYIATQGPLPETFADFWRMVWEEGSVTIVMLTKLEERSRIKCDQYWPTKGSASYGFIQVTLLDTLELAHYTIRTMQLQHRGSSEMREIRHLQYTAWPDHGVPDHPTPFLMFLKRVKTLNRPDAGPIISHCSAGIGRTGAFIVIDCMLERLRYENTVDIFGCVTALRSQRSYMVQTDDQYIFIHDAVLDAVQSGSTEVPASKLYTHIQALLQIQPVDQASGMELEFRHLATLKTLNSRCAVANLPVNRPKNRLVNMIPYDSTRVALQATPGIDGSDYINASWIDGYRQRNAYIATQAPLPHTVNDFWRMIWEHESSILVMLIKARELGREKYCEYWPAESGAQFGFLVVEPIAEYNMPQYVLREFRVTDTQSGQSRTVRHFQYTEWPEQGPPKNAEFFIDFIHQVHRTKTQFGIDGPITVHCSTGAGRTGVFIALSIIIDRMKLEHVVDVFTTVKLLRTERQNMVQDKDQYHFCYQAALEFLATYDTIFQ